MSRFGGSSSVRVAASASSCFELVCDAPRTPEWHEAITTVTVLERGEEGRPSLVRARIAAIVVCVEVDLRVTYWQYRAVCMRRESGDLRELTAAWTFRPVDSKTTHASFRAEFDPGPKLSLLARGPIITRLTALLAEQPPSGLKRALEGQ